MNHVIIVSLDRNYIAFISDTLFVYAEEIDWYVYNILAKNHLSTVDELINQMHLPGEVIDASVDRLRRACLIDRTEKGIRVLSFNEVLIRNQFKNTENCPFNIENGVIKLKKTGIS